MKEMVAPEVMITLPLKNETGLVLKQRNCNSQEAKPFVSNVVLPPSTHYTNVRKIKVCSACWPVCLRLFLGLRDGLIALGGWPGRQREHCF